MLQVNRISSIDWKPSPVLALATSVDGSQVAAAREDGSLEIWLVSPGSVGWHCQLTIHGDPNSRVSSLVYCRSISKSVAPGRLFSSSIDGSISEWDLFNLKQKIVLDSIGVSIWQMAVEPLDESLQSAHNDSYKSVNGYANDEISSLENDEKGEIDDDDDDDDDNDNDDNVELHVQPVFENPRVAIGCDDGSVRLYAVSDSDGLTYRRSMHRVSGRILSVVWSLDAKLIFAGGSDGFIRCWNAKLAHEIYRITVGHGSLGGGSEICVWSLLFLRSGTLVSADSSGRVQFWDSQHGTLLQAHSCHKGDVNALAASPSHSRVFSAGSDGQIVLYKPTEMAQSDNGKSSTVVRKWVYVGYLRAHTHDVRALTVAVPISSEGEMPNDKVKRIRGHEKPVDFSYHKWAHLGVPMLISAGDDTKLFAYSVKEFTKFAPHDICPAPQRVPIHLVLNTLTVGAPLLLVQCCDFLDVLKVNAKSAVSAKRYGKNSGTQLLARVKCKDSRKIVCCAISWSGVLFAYSDHVKPSLFELKNCKIGKSVLDVKKRELPRKLPFAHSMVFSTDSSQLMIAGHDRKIYVVDVDRAELLYSFTPRRKEVDNNSLPNEPPITKMFTSSDGQWLATANCFGDIYIFNLEVQRQHWFIARLDGASVTAGGFPPSNSSILIITTSSNQVYVFDVEAKQLGEWSKQNTFLLPRRFLEFPGEVIGLSFPPKNSTSVVIYSARAMCLIDFGKPIDQDDDCNLTNGLDLSCKELGNSVNAVGIKRKLKDSSFQCNYKQRRNFNFSAFRDPVHFVGHLSEDSVLIVEKSWSDIVAKFDAPVHRHIFGT